MEILVPSHVGIHNVVKTFFQIAFEPLQHFNLTGCYLNIFLILRRTKTSEKVRLFLSFLQKPNVKIVYSYRSKTFDCFTHFFNVCNIFHTFLFFRRLKVCSDNVM